MTGQGVRYAQEPQHEAWKSLLMEHLWPPSAACSLGELPHSLKPRLGPEQECGCL
jgi:hypothetical protein